MIRAVYKIIRSSAAVVGSIATIIGLCAVTVTAQATAVVVPGYANPWLAGMPDGSTTSPAYDIDTAPAQSPVSVSGVVVDSGILVFSDGSGGVFNIPGNCCDPLDGGIFQGQAFIDHSVYAENGIAALRAPINSLLGVFLDDSQPSLLAAPAGLDFETIGLDFLSLAPMLRQVFFIGDGYNSGNIQQQFVIPVGATRLFLGTMDGHGWANNDGAFSIVVNNIAVVPVPAAGWLLGSALLVMGSCRRQFVRASAGQEIAA